MAFVRLAATNDSFTCVVPLLVARWKCTVAPVALLIVVVVINVVVLVIQVLQLTRIHS